MVFALNVKNHHGWIACAIFSVSIVVFLLVSGIFWWPGTKKTLSFTIRLFIVLGVMILLIAGHKPKVDLTFLIFLSFWLYLCINACIFGNWQVMRRLLVIFCFIYTCSIDLNRLSVCRRIIMIAMVLAWLSAVMALFSQISLEGISFSYRATPIEAGFGNPVDAGTHYAPVFTFIVWLALTATKRLGSCIWSVCALTLTILLYLTWSRTAWLAGFVSVTFLLCFLAHRIVKKISIYAFVISIILLIIYEHQVVLSEIIGRGLTQRDIIWLNIIDRMQGYWLVGHGAGAKLGTFFLQDGFTVSHAHNLYLEVLYQYGLGGVILMLISSFACLVKLFRLRKDQLAALWFSLLVSGMLAMCFAMSNFVGTPNRIWVFYWLPLAGALAMPSSEKLRDVSYQCSV